MRSLVFLRCRLLRCCGSDVLRNSELLMVDFMMISVLPSRIWLPGDGRIAVLVTSGGVLLGGEVSK